MNSRSLRANTVIIKAVFVLMALCAVASFTYYLNRSSPYVDFQILRYGSLQRLNNGEGKGRI